MGSALDPSRYSLEHTIEWTTWCTHREKVFEKHLETHRGRPVDFLEIGSFEGASALWLLENVLTHPKSTLTCVDDDRLSCGDTLSANLERSGQRDQVTILWEDSKNLRRLVPDEAFDFVYVDACHEAPAVLSDVLTAFLITKVGGLVACDDYNYDRLDNGSRPKEAIDAFLEIYARKVELVYRDYQLWFRKREA